MDYVRRRDIVLGLIPLLKEHHKRATLETPNDERCNEALLRLEDLVAFNDTNQLKNGLKAWSKCCRGENPNPFDLLYDILFGPLEDVPLFIGHPQFGSVASWRIKLSNEKRGQDFS